MSLKCGIVGLPNVGKSTLFNSLSKNKAEAANFPFCTIEPNVGMITVPDERCNYWRSWCIRNAFSRLLSNLWTLRAW